MRERSGEHLLPLSLYQANCDIALMLSWYSAGYGWPLTDGNGNVDAADGVEIPRTCGFARRAEWIFGDVVPFKFLMCKC